MLLTTKKKCWLWFSTFNQQLFNHHCDLHIH
jgi:hypothetical protein